MYIYKWCITTKMTAKATHIEKDGKCTWDPISGCQRQQTVIILASMMEGKGRGKGEGERGKGEGGRGKGSSPISPPLTFHAVRQP
jgi:hypothetical protein